MTYLHSFTKTYHLLSIPVRRGLVLMLLAALFFGAAPPQAAQAAAGTWTASGNLNTARGYHTATLLPDGKVLVAGGRGSSSGYLNSAEVYDPATGAWTASGTLKPRREIYQDSGQTMTIPATRSTVSEDFYVILAGWDNAGQLATFKTYLNPLINWLWFGGLVFVIGTMVAVWPDVEAERRAVGRQVLTDGGARQYA